MRTASRVNTVRTLDAAQYFVRVPPPSIRSEPASAAYLRSWWVAWCGQPTGKPIQEVTLGLALCYASRKHHIMALSVGSR